MSGGGFISSMGDSIKRNRSLLSRNKNRRRESFEQLKNSSHPEQRKFVQKKYSANKLFQIKKRLEKETREEQKKFIIALLFLGVFSLVSFILIMWYMGVL